MAGAIVSPGSDRWGSPLPLFNNLHQRYDFTIDGAADSLNGLLPRYWGPGSDIAEDALAVPWTGERPFLNPPFSMVDDFLRKGKHECRQHGVPSIFVVKVATGKKVWADAVWDGAGNVGDIIGRLSYRRDEGAVGATFDSCIVVYDPYWPEGLPPVHWQSDRLGNFVMKPNEAHALWALR